MKRLLLSVLMAAMGVVLWTATPQVAPGAGTSVPLDSLASAPELWAGRLVVVDGKAAHICPVEGMKLKLKSESGNVANVVPGDGRRFDAALSGKAVRVTGTVEIRKVFESDLKALEADTWIPCHVDYQRCKDKAYVENLEKAGKRASASRDEIEKVRKKMRDSGKDFVVVLTIVARTVELLP